MSLHLFHSLYLLLSLGFFSNFSLKSLEDETLQFRLKCCRGGLEGSKVVTPPTWTIPSLTLTLTSRLPLEKNCWLIFPDLLLCQLRWTEVPVYSFMFKYSFVRVSFRGSGLSLHCSCPSIEKLSTTLLLLLLLCLSPSSKRRDIKMCLFFFSVI